MLQQIPTTLEQDQILGLDVRAHGGYMGGGFIGGYKAGLLRFHSIFYDLLEANKHEFIGKDQEWFERACVENEGLCALVKPDRDHGDPWFFMAPYMMGMINSADGNDSNVKFCGSNKWKETHITCEKRAQFLVERYKILEQNAKSSILESGCQCNAQQKPKSNIGVSLLQPLASRNKGICTFCMGGVFNRDTVVPGTGGNTCGSIVLMAAGEVNGSDICATIQKEERVCCRGTNKNESAVGLSKEEGDTLVEVPRFNSSLTPWNISAIIPTCNRLHSLQDAIESALKQTYPVLEVIVSIDSSPSCVKSIKNIWESKDDRVRVVKVPPCPKQNHCGAGRIRNYGIEKASPYATHFALLDDDDVWYPQKTEIQVKAMQEGHYLYASSDANAPRNGRCQESEYKSHDLEKGSFYLYHGGAIKGYISKKLNISLDAKLPSHVTREELSSTNIFIASATIFSKDIFYATSGFDEGIDRAEDYHLWLDFAKISPGLFITDPLVVYDNKRNGCDITYTSSLYDDGPPPTKCTFCMGGVFNRDTVVPGTGGKTCGSIMLIASGEVNGSVICATIQKEERVCCSGNNKNESAVGLSKEEGDTLVNHIQMEKSVCCQEIVKHKLLGGRLGNQLFEHAATLAIAKATGKQACVFGTNVALIDKYFTVDGVFVRNCTNIIPSQSVSETGYGIFSPLPKADRSLEIFGYFQSWKYFAGAEAKAEIMRAFTLKPEYLRHVDEIFGEEGKDSYHNVGIHLRWFEVDYLNDPPKEFYQSAMEYFRGKYGQRNKPVRFYLASNDIERSKMLGIFSDESVVILNNQEAIYDFAVLMSCEGMILSSGTFGWWAAWLGPHQRNGEVFYFSDVFDMKKRVNKGQVQKEDYYPPNWKEIAPEDLLSQYI